MSFTQMPRMMRLLVMVILLMSALPISAGVAQDQLIVPIAEIDGSGVFGDATLIDNGDGTTTIDILVGGATGGHPVWLREGTCDDLGPEIADLEEIDDEGVSLTDLDEPLADLLAEGPLAVYIEFSATRSSVAIACGDIAQAQPVAAPAGTAAPTPAPTQPAPAPTPTIDPALPVCQNFDAWIWAQSVFVEDPERYAPTLDPDGNGIACEQLPLRGFAPVLWTDRIPENLVPVTVTAVVDGDTFQILVNGQVDYVRMHHIEGPDPSECGFVSSRAYLAFVLGIAPGRTLYLEYDGPERDDQGLRLAYVWYELGGDPYLANEVMVRGGWAASEPSGGTDPYSRQFREAEQFSVDHVLGVRLECGRFNQPPGSSPTADQIAQARARQPNQGQL
jgi:endonuclease YncB( thermonuclease family)